MTESFQPAGTPEAGANTGENFRDELVADYLCAATPAGEKKALNALRQDEFRLAMAGMTLEQRELWNNLDKVDWKAVQREGLTAVMPALFGVYVGLTSSPENATRIATVLGSAGFGLEMLSMAAVMPEAVARHQRASGLAKAIAAVRVGTFYAGKVGIFAALGTGVAGLVHMGWEAQAAAQPAAGGGEGLADHHPRPDVIPAGDLAGSAADELEAMRDSAVSPLSGQPPVLSPAAGEFVNQAGEVAAQEAKEMAEAAQGATEMAARQAALDAATRIVQVQPGNTLTGLIDAAGGNAYGKDFTDTVLQSANILTGPQNPNRDIAGALIEFIKAHPGGVNWRDAINGVGDLARQTVGGLPLKDAIAQATRMIYPGQEMKVVVGAAMP